MGVYDFPGQIAESDGSEGNGSMGAVFIVLENPTTTGSIRVGRTEEVTDSTRSANDGPTRSSDWGEREREFSSNGG